MGLQPARSLMPAGPQTPQPRVLAAEAAAARNQPADEDEAWEAAGVCRGRSEMTWEAVEERACSGKERWPARSRAGAA